MFKGTIATMNELIANEVMAQIEGLTLVKENPEGWEWAYRNCLVCHDFFESPLDAFIDFTKTVLETNDKLTGGDISYDED